MKCDPDINAYAAISAPFVQPILNHLRERLGRAGAERAGTGRRRFDTTIVQLDQGKRLDREI